MAIRLCPLLLLVLSSSLALVSGNIIFPSDADADASANLSTLQDTVQDLMRRTEPFFDGGIATVAQVPSDTPELQFCLFATLILLDQAVPGGLAAPFASETALFCLLGNDCDFSPTSYSIEAASNCEAVNGTLRSGDIYLCNDEFGTTGLGADTNVKMSNIPVCLDPICAEDITFQRMLKTLFELGSDDDNSFEKTFTGQCAPIEIEWRIPTTPFPGRTAKVGDTVTFNYENFHNVYIHPTGDCDEMGSVLVGENAGPALYTFSEEDAGQTITFACDIGSHCEAGQIISFQVEEITTAPTMTPTVASTLLPAEDFKTGIDNGEYDLILDVRTRAEWEAGHIVGATFADSLASFGTSTHTGAVPSDFAGCEFCTIAVYCRSGARSRVAIQILASNGFEGQLYNAQGVNQWQAAGFPLVNDDSIVPPCTTSEDESCPGTGSPSSSPSKAPSDAPVLVLPIRKVPKTTDKFALKIKRTTPGTNFVQANGMMIRGGGGRRQLSSYYPQELPSSD
ncbi:unnamed protein product [Cylindrotheca closterium]|uniref:Rhodanese domain-containing protein n=1 Tax=Cylindrotheca closterium TaxID=2856 RepID=A0AAD2FH04_9STRA|nr:unnamed protein product [Cylindrotheca closterium]